MLELDSKLVKLLHAIRNRGGVVNIHVVRASAKALIDTNMQGCQQLSHFDIPQQTNGNDKTNGYNITPSCTKRSF